MSHTGRDLRSSPAIIDAERLELYGPWFKHPVTGKFVDARELPKDKNLISAVHVGAPHHTKR